MKLEGKVALVTGAGSGMGRAIAQVFAKEEAKVSVVDLDAAKGQETVDLIKQAGGAAKFIRADVSLASDAEKMIKETASAFGRLDVVVNNAGVPMGPPRLKR